MLVCQVKRDRETQRHRDRETERQRDREKERQRDRETVWHGYGYGINDIQHNTHLRAVPRDKGERKRQTDRQIDR